MAEWNEIFGGEAQVEFGDASLMLGDITNLPSDECPSLGFFRECYGAEAYLWVAEHVSMFNKVVQAAIKLSEAQIKLLSVDIINAHPDLNLGELCVFFARARQARYGSLFNQVDNMQIMKWLNAFRRERFDELSRYEDMQRKLKAAEAAKASPNAISMDEYIERCKKAGKDTVLGGDARAYLKGEDDGRRGLRMIGQVEDK